MFDRYMYYNFLDTSIGFYIIYNEILRRFFTSKYWTNVNSKGMVLTFLADFPKASMQSHTIVFVSCPTNHFFGTHMWLGTMTMHISYLIKIMIIPRLVAILVFPHFCLKLLKCSCNCFKVTAVFVLAFLLMSSKWSIFIWKLHFIQIRIYVIFIYIRIIVAL